MLPAPGIVLIHGYSGSFEDLSPLGLRLSAQFGRKAVCIVRLPGHTADSSPGFDTQAFRRSIDEAIHRFLEEKRHIVILGHSTGGILALDHLHRKRVIPSLLVLAGTPAVIRGCDLGRWERHRQNRREIDLTDVARMVSFVNTVASLPVTDIFPVLILQGGADPLVLPGHARRWLDGRFPGFVRRVIIPGAGHDLFNGTGSSLAVDCVCRAITDVRARLSMAERDAINTLGAMDGEVEAFAVTRPHSAHHLVRSPAALRALRKPVNFTSAARTDPIHLNIEITSRCNLFCEHCARSHLKRPAKDMGREVFRYLLDLMPNTYKVTLVGLGEPTLHPQLVEFVASASRRGHRVGIVTNAMNLDRYLSRKLIAAGLCGLTFSLDSVDADLVHRVRQGSDIERIIENIEGFVQMAAGKVPTAVFTAVSQQTVRHLPELATLVSGLGVNAWMLSDLNFRWNQFQTLRENWTPVDQKTTGSALKLAFAKALPVLSVRGLEEIGLPRRFKDFLIISPVSLGRLSGTHRWCLSPWQTLPVDVDGNASICDCLPHVSLGNLLERGFSDIWNGTTMRSHRRLMRSASPPADCLACPRF